MAVYMDGCFDLFHHGHANALRQAAALGTKLLAGVVSDDFIARYKVPPVLTLHERCEMVASARFVDHVLPDVPFVVDVDMLRRLKDMGVTRVVHGSDCSDLPDGTDAYRAARDEGMFTNVPRTEGVITTDIVRALLMRTRVPPSTMPFSLPSWIPPGDAVYVDGAFDCLHYGHVTFLKKLHQSGRKVLVGVHSDDTVKARRGTYPIFGMIDRARALLACKYVDGVMIDTPAMVTSAFLSSVGCSKVARGIVHESAVPDGDRYAPVSDRLVGVLSPSFMTLETLRRRVTDHKDHYLRKIGSYKESTMEHTGGGRGGGGT